MKTTRKRSLIVSTVVVLLMIVFRPTTSNAESQTSIPTGGAPAGVTVDTDNGDLYVANSFDYVTVIDPATGVAIQNISIPEAAPGLLAFPTDIAYDKATNRMFLADLALPGLWIIDAQTNKVVGNITLGSKYEYDSPLPGQVICVSGRVFLTDTSLGMVYVFDARTGASLANISIGNYPQQMAYDPDNGDLYVALGTSNVTTVVDASTYKAVENVTVPDAPLAVAYGGGDIYVTEADSNKVAVINGSTNTVTGEIRTLKDPLAVIYTAGPHILVFGNQSDQVSVIGVGASSGSYTLAYKFESGFVDVIYDQARGLLCETFQNTSANNGLDCLVVQLETSSVSTSTSRSESTTTGPSSTTETSTTGTDIPLLWEVAGAVSVGIVVVGVLFDLREKNRTHRT